MPRRSTRCVVALATTGEEEGGREFRVCRPVPPRHVGVPIPTPPCPSPSPPPHPPAALFSITVALAAPTPTPTGDLLWVLAARRATLRGGAASRGGETFTATLTLTAPSQT